MKLTKNTKTHSPQKLLEQLRTEPPASFEAYYKMFRTFEQNLIALLSE